jgi:adenylate cyclase class 2
MNDDLIHHSAFITHPLVPMAVEIEAKIKVDDLAPTRAKLQEAGAKFVADQYEVNAIFDTEDRSLLAADKGLRVRSAKDLKTGEETCTVTFKGPRKHSALKSRQENEVKVEGFQAAVELLEALSFHQVLAFEKRRQSWELGNCKIELDELPHLGCFVEIEGHSEKAIQKVQETLGLGHRPIVKTAYVGLMMTYLQDHGHSDRFVRFPS